MTPTLGVVYLFGFNYPPKGYALAAAQLLAIQQNAALFSILGTTYGGNGTTTFALPDLRGRTPISWQQGPGLSNYALGQQAGNLTTTLNATNLPLHNHTMSANSVAPTTGLPGNSVLGKGATVGSGTNVGPLNLYSTNGPNATMATGSMANNGGSQPVSIVQPFLVLNFSVALQGIFPTRN